MASGRKLTVKAIEALKGRSARYYVNDGAGLNVAVEPSGTKRFYLRYRADGKACWMKLSEQGRDTFPAVSLEVARRLAAEAQAGLKAGTDPMKEKKAELLEARARQADRLALAAQQLARPTVNALFDHWMNLELSKRKDAGIETARGFHKDILPVIGDMPAETVKQAHVMTILDAVVMRGANRMAKRFLSEMRQMFGFALDREMIPVDPTARIKKDRIGGKATMRERHLSEEEIRILASRLPEAKLLKTTEIALWIMLATCCRVGELSRARWHDLDLERGTWLIPDEHAKNARQLVVYLSDFAVRQFHQLEALKADEVWVLPNRNGKTHLDTKTIAKQIHDRQRLTAMSKRTSATATLCLPGGPWTPHDLRRTGATMMGTLGVAPHVIERCLNHLEQNRMARTYQHQKLIEEQASAWRLLGDRLSLLAQPVDNVIPLPAQMA